MDKAHDSLDCVQPAAAFPKPACWQGFGQGLALAKAVAPGTDLALGLGAGEDVTRLLRVVRFVRNPSIRIPGPTPIKQVSARSTFVSMADRPQLFTWKIRMHIVR